MPALDCDELFSKLLMLFDGWWNYLDAWFRSLICLPDQQRDGCLQKLLGAGACLMGSDLASRGNCWQSRFRATNPANVTVCFRDV